MTRISSVLLLVIVLGPWSAGRSAAQPAAISVTVADAVSRGFATSHRLAEVKARDRKSTRLNSSHIQKSRMPSSA